MTPISLSDLQDAFEFASTDGGGLNEAFLDRETGRIHFRSDYFGDFEEDEEEALPEDLPADRYVRIPDRKELNLGRRLVLDFAEQFLPDDYDDVYDIFRRKGAYGRFKSLLVRRHALERWHDYSNKAEEAALRQWCAENDIPLKD